MASITIEALAVAFRKALKLLLTSLLCSIGSLFALRLAVRAIAKSVVFLVALDRLLADFFTYAFCARATRNDKERREKQESGLLPVFHPAKLSSCLE